MNDSIESLSRSLSGRYSVDRELGQGGMATVYLGQDLKHGRRVAIKVLRPELAVQVGFDRFQREIRTIASFTHPNILPLHDSGQAGDLPFFVMPYVEGETLRDHLKRQGRLSLSEAITIACEVAEALDYAHRKGCIHRDIKPENILLCEGHAIVTDFGVARAVAASGNATLTSSGYVLGTPAYVSPEQAAGDKRLDERSDVYALGCVLYEMLAGEPPFTGPTAQSVIAKHIGESVPSLKVVRADVPPHITMAVTKALSKVAADRYGGPTQFARALTATEVSTGSTPRPWTAVGSVLQRHTRGLRVMGLLVLVAVAASLAFPALRRVFRPTPVYSVENPERQFIVIPHTPARNNPEEEGLTRQAEDELTRLLTGWDQIRAVPRVSKAGLVFDLGLSDFGGNTLRDALRIARRARVGTLIMLDVRVSGDNAFLEAQLYDVASADAVGRPYTSIESKADVFALVVPVATGILGFSGAPQEFLSFQRESGNLAAVQRFQSGREDLERWRLERAAESFRVAVTDDSTFARAHYYLALALYWQAARDFQRLPELGGEIRRHAGAARRHGGPLGFRDSVYVEAFNEFQNGDYDAARGRYRDLVNSDSTDSYAWLLLGSVEYQDPWAAARPQGPPLPRGNLNLAQRAFTTGVRLSPDFLLGYGHLFDIYTELAQASRIGSCLGYEPPRNEVVFIWQARDPTNQIMACPVVRDSIEWVEPAVRATLEPQPLVAGALGFSDAAMIELQRWAEYAPNDPRPAQELARWTLARRELLRPTSQPETRDSLVVAALRHAQRALALSTDTTAADLARLGSLHLAAGAVDSAVAITRLAVDAAAAGQAGGTGTLPFETANLFLATGQIEAALRVVLPVATARRLSVQDTATGRLYAVRADGAVARLRVYGGSGLAAQPIRTALAELEQAWMDASYTAEQTDVLRRAVAGWIAPALIADDAEVRRWFANRDPATAILLGFANITANPAAAGLVVDSLQTSAEPGLTPDEAYLGGVLAQRLGRHRQAVELFERQDRLTPRIHTMDEGWGLRTLSRLWRARSYEALGDTTAARRYYDGFARWWNLADPAVQHLATEAREALTRLR